MKVLRTPEERFAGLPGFGYPPRYADVGDAIAALTLLTGFIAWIAARTTLLAVRGRLFPAS
jgi:haloalkane dehalogenase